MLRIIRKKITDPIDNNEIMVYNIIKFERRSWKC